MNIQEELKKRGYKCVWANTLANGDTITHWSKEERGRSSNKREIIVREFSNHFTLFQPFDFENMTVERNLEILDEPQPGLIIKKQKNEIERITKLNKVLTDNFSSLKADFKKFLKDKFGGNLV